MTSEPDVPKGARRKILVVDDDPGLRSVIQRILARRGYDVVVVMNGPAAVDALGAARFDLALIDFVMPGMDGRDVALALRASAPGLPVVFMSGADQGSAVTALDASFIAKPFTPAELGDVIARVLAPDQRG